MTGKIKFRSLRNKKQYIHETETQSTVYMLNKNWFSNEFKNCKVVLGTQRH